MEDDETTSWVAEELTGLSLPDRRFAANVISIAEHPDEHTGYCFSAACGERPGQECMAVVFHQRTRLTRYPSAPDASKMCQ